MNEDGRQSSGRSGGVAAGAVVDDEIDMDLVLSGPHLGFCRILEHLRIQHAADHFVKGQGLGIGFLIVHAQGSDKADDCLVSPVEKLRSHLGKLLPQRRQPSPPVRSDTKSQVECLYAMLHAPCAMRFSLSCPIHPAYRSLAVPMNKFWRRSRNWKFFELVSGDFAMITFFKKTAERKHIPIFP